MATDIRKYLAFEQSLNKPFIPRDKEKDMELLNKAMEAQKQEIYQEQCLNAARRM